jgi:metal-sulfur cluster biosynthetic enzyme/nitrite reductase/ring-hydroxylating ferredoxin subunit
MPEFTRVADVSEIADPGTMLVEVDGEVVALFHVEGRFYAIDDVCTHDGGPLVDGELTGYKIACPRHGAKFDIRTGAALSMPAVRPTRAHLVKVEDGGVWVALESGPGSTPGPNNQAADFRSYTPTNTAASAAEATASAPDASVGSPASAPSTPGTAGTSPAAETATTEAGIPSEEAVREWLKEVKDPELFVNIVDLGLIYGVTLSPAADAPGKHHVAIDMTMTSPACPAGPQLIADTKRTVSSRDSIAAVEVRIVMDPPWTPDRMTDAARDQLGIF